MAYSQQFATIPLDFYLLIQYILIKQINLKGQKRLSEPSAKPDVPEIPDVYSLETIEQMRAIADQLRIRIIDHLATQPMTVTQLAELIGIAPNKLHYHVRELERAGLLKQVATREKGGILEKYYRSVAKRMQIPASLLRELPLDDAVAAFRDIAQPIFQSIIDAAGNAFHKEEPFQFTQSSYWMTKEELEHVNQSINTLLQPYKERRAIEHEQKLTLMWIAYTNPPLQDHTEETKQPAESPTNAQTPAEPAKTAKHRLMIVAGVTTISRQNLETAISQGEVLDVYVLGSCSFAKDITPELVDRAIASFRLWGKLSATAAVSAALEHKKVKSGK